MAAEYALVLVSKSWNGKRKLKVKQFHKTRKEASEALRVLHEKQAKFGGFPADYRVLGPVQLKGLQAEIQGEQASRRAKGAVKAAATRKARGSSSFTLCPHCKAKSKKLFSEFGGLETRVCQRGHKFEFDRPQGRTYRHGIQGNL